jgi:ppGpp synthetase/RelA/SpoT-type nucleotidyltranferase
MISKNRVRKAGDICAGKAPATDQEIKEAHAVVNAWRNLHQEPLSCLINDVAPITSEYKNAILAGRLKKYSTIVNKLGRDNQTHKLNTMYDIAGCRIVVDGMKEQAEICKLLQNISSLDKDFSAKHSYVNTPRSSGYRAEHLIFKYIHSENNMALRAELQIRTRLQHQWSTAVELYDFAKDTNLKFNECEDMRVRNFFRTASRVIQAIEENTPECADASFLDKDTARTILTTLESANESVWLTPLAQKKTDDPFYLLDFAKDVQTLQIEAMSSSNALQAYFNKETSPYSDLHDVVLVCCNSFDTLKLAYPNYFGDMSDFIHLVKKHLDF